MSKSRSKRWRAQHQGKIVHLDPESAQAHADHLNFECPRPGEMQTIYACHWNKWHTDGETAPEHWHTGRTILGHLDENSTSKVNSAP